MGNGNGAAVHKSYGTVGYPDLVIIGPDKKFIRTYIWPIPSLASLEAAFPSGKLMPHSCTVTDVSKPVFAKNISIYPNPAEDFIYMEFINGTTHSTGFVQLYNLVGEKLLELNGIKSNMLKIDIAKLPTGVYFIRYEAGNEAFIQKFFKIN